MKHKFWLNVLMAVLVAGLFLTVSCAKKAVVSDAGKVSGAATTEDPNAQAKIDAERLAAEKAAKERAAKIAAARKAFENEDVHFDFDSSELTGAAKALLKDKAAWLTENASAAVTIEGHCDERGTTEYNLALGDRRATAAKAYLVDLGIAASRMDTISYGEEKPVDTGKTELAWAMNRRAHFVIK
jgi:peptidoglycan-associated lipoprotein